jgi:capsular polysaccharide biosynthesis protein
MPASAVSTVGRALRHWHWLIWLTALIAGLLAYAATFVRPPVYEASALVSIDESTSQTQGFDVAMQADQFLAQRFISLGESRDVRQAVCAKEGAGCDPTALAGQVRVTTPKATAQLQIAADASSPQVAARLANETADALIARNHAQVNDQLLPQRTLLQGQLKQLSDEISQALQQTSALEAAGRSDAAGLQQLTFLQTQYASTYQRVQDLDKEISQRGDVLTVEERAAPPLTPIDPDPARYVLVGLGGGLAVGLLAALVAERLRQRIQHASELAEATGTELVVDLSQGGPRGCQAAYGFLARMGRAGSAGGPRALLLVGSTDHDSVNDVGMELAQAIAASHKRVLVLPATGAPPLVVADDGGQAAAGTHEDIDIAIHCSLPPMKDPAFDRLKPAPDRAVVVATRGLTKFIEARLTADLLRAIGVEVAAALLLPRRLQPSAASQGDPEAPRARAAGGGGG